MKESKLTPFDAETILMIKSVTGHEPEVTEKAELFEMRMYVDDKNEYVITAAINAVIGRYGMRVRAVDYIREEIFLRGATFFVEYKKGAEDLPNEARADKREPNEKAGYLYCRRLLEVRAVPVTRDNIERLIDFTGGGTMEIPRKPGGIGLYSFITENGVIMSVPERWAVIRFPDGRFGKMEYEEFVETFEEKDENKPVEFPGVNVVFAKDQPEYIPLPAMKVQNDPQGLVITKWQLSPEELERVKETGTIHLSMLTFNQPLQPVLLTVDFPTDTV